MYVRTYVCVCVFLHALMHGMVIDVHHLLLYKFDVYSISALEHHAVCTVVLLISSLWGGGAVYSSMHVLYSILYIVQVYTMQLER